MDYEHIFKRAGIIAWKYKILWLFGILAGCGANTSSSNYSSWSQSLSNSGGGYTNPNDPFSNFPPEMERFFYEFGQMMEQNAGVIFGWVFAFFCVALILNFVFFVLRTYGFAGLTSAVANIERNGLESINFQTVSQLGDPYLMRLLGLGILLALPGFIMGSIFFLVIMGTAFSSNGDADAIFSVIILLMCCLGCIAIFVGIAIQVIGGLAKTALVIDDLGIMDALRQGWTVLKEHFGNYFILALMMFALSLLIGMVMIIPAMIVAAPAMGLFFSQGPELFFENIGRNMLSMIGLSLCMWPFMAALRGIITTFTTNVWTIAYLEVTDVEPMIDLSAPDTEFSDFAPVPEVE